MTLTLWGAVLYGLPWLLLGVVGLALVLSVRDKRRSGYTAADVRRSVERTGMWSVHPLAPLGEAVTQPRPATGRAGVEVPAPEPVVETTVLHRVEDPADATVLLPQVPSQADWAEGWNDPGPDPEAEPGPEPETEPEPESDEPPVDAGNPLFDQTLAAMRETGGDATAVIEAVTGDHPTVPPLADAYDVFDDDQEQEQHDEGDDPGAGGGTPTAERELEVQTAALPAVPAAMPLPAAHRYQWPQQPARWSPVRGVLPNFVPRRRMVELTQQWQELRRRGEVEVRRVADPAQRLMQQIRADLAERRTAEGRAAGLHRADGFRSRAAAV